MTRMPIRPASIVLIVATLCGLSAVSGAEEPRAEQARCGALTWQQSLAVFAIQPERHVHCGAARAYMRARQVAPRSHPAAEIASVDVTPPAPGEIHEALAREMENVRRHNAYDGAGLGVRIKEVIPLLKPYLRDPDDEVRESAVELLSYESSPRTLDLLAAALRDRESAVSARALKVLYDGFWKSQVRNWGTIQLWESLTQYALAHPDSGAALALLTCRGPQATAVLTRLRAAHPGARVSMPLEREDPIPLTQGLDISLAELGDSRALARVRGGIGKQNLEFTLFFIDGLKFVERPGLVLLAVRLLGEKTPARPTSLLWKPIYMRVCDLAASVMKVKLGKKDYYDGFNLPEKQAELDTLYRESRRLLAVAPVHSWRSRRLPTSFKSVR